MRKFKKNKAKTATKPEPTEEIGRDGEGKAAIRVKMLGVVCPRCKSPKRTPFIRRERVLDFDFVFKEPTLGVSYNRIIYRRCRCADCGQLMEVREYTMKPPKA